MPTIRSLAFLTPGNFLDDDPRTGLESTLALFATGERLGFQGAWVRQRHLEHGISSAATFLAAATQRTTTIELGTAVIPIGYESPFRLGEDLATVDVLSRGRLQAGLSAGTPPHVELLGEKVFDGDWRDVDFSHARIERLADGLRGTYLGDEDTRIVSPGNVQRPRLQPHSPGLVERLWYGAASRRSTLWAAEHGLHLLTGNIVAGEGTGDFVAAQRANLAAFRAAWAGAHAPRVALGRVVVPTDGADRATRERYREYARSRHERTLAPVGPRRTLFAPDLVGSSDEIVERILEDAAVGEVDELRLELPYELTAGDYEQILHDVATLVAPRLGWQPAGAAAAAAGAGAGAAAR
ncbi:monooxygenase [Cellulomonas chitinilytica]|uniref:Monooxygenase n=1 Tax=Cellulomonas chitinilytica TaxID=398759 RepID=A0A919P2N2_9CELL|nr:LLM class flavin-dependent oxidoreductase [Cellulomonas chitinilytica]GIG22286.1 monooxygenase [Cellulomonas chitinilytica]